MRLNERCDLVNGGFPVDRQIALPELFGYPWSCHVYANDLATVTVGFALGNDLYDAIDLTEDERSTVAPILVFRNYDVDPGFLRALL